MSGHRTHIIPRKSNLTLVALMVTGILAWTYGSRFPEETRLLELSECPADESLIWHHNTASGAAASTLSQLTGEEVLAAGLALQDDVIATQQATVQRYQWMQLALISASILWLAGLMTLVFQSEGRTQTISVTPDHMPCCDGEDPAGRFDTPACGHP